MNELSIKLLKNNNDSFVQFNFKIKIEIIHIIFLYLFNSEVQLKKFISLSKEIRKQIVQNLKYKVDIPKYIHNVLYSKFKLIQRDEKLVNINAKLFYKKYRYLNPFQIIKLSDQIKQKTNRYQSYIFSVQYFKNNFAKIFTNYTSMMNEIEDKNQICKENRTKITVNSDKYIVKIEDIQGNQLKVNLRTFNIYIARKLINMDDFKNYKIKTLNKIKEMYTEYNYNLLINYNSKSQLVDQSYQIELNNYPQNIHFQQESQYGFYYEVFNKSDIESFQIIQLNLFIYDFLTMDRKQHIQKQSSSIATITKILLNLPILILFLYINQFYPFTILIDIVIQQQLKLRLHPNIKQIFQAQFISMFILILFSTCVRLLLIILSYQIKIDEKQKPIQWELIVKFTPPLFTSLSIKNQFLRMINYSI